MRCIMLTSYFLGANSKDGFHSLYNTFPQDNKAILHIIKGGPGTGKSGFMRAIGKSAEEKGFEVEYVLCSGDPDSLDGVFIPELHQAWADGTAPHAMDPGTFGVDGDYVNLGRFCRTPVSDDDGSEISRLTYAYRAEYKRAYSYLAAAAELHRAALSEMFGEKERALIRRRISGILSRHANILCKSNYVNYSYLSAISCKGIIHLNEPISKLCKLIYRFDSSFGGDVYALKFAAEEAMKRALPVIICPSPLDPELIDAVLLPFHSLAFLSREWEMESAKLIQLDRYLSPELRKDNRACVRRTHQLYSDTRELAVERLRAAKELHDELEAVYYNYMDFPALTKFTEEEIKRVLE